MRPVNLPVAACAAPSRSSIRFANEHVLAVEFFKTRAIGVIVRSCLISLCGLKIPFLSTARLNLCVLFGGSGAERRYSGIELNNEKYSDVCCERQEKEYKV